MEKPKVLVVEDEKDVARVIAINLQLEDMDVVQVHDGKDALPAIQSERPDCLVLDIMLPHVSGWEILKSLKADPHLSEMPVVVVTARVNEREQLRGLGGGAVKYITKPFNPDELTEAIKSSLEPEAKGLLAKERREAIERLQLSTLHKVSQVLISASGYEELLCGISDRLVSLYDLSACAFIIFNGEEPQAFLLKTAPGSHKKNIPESEIPVSAELAEKLKKVIGDSPRPVRIRDIGEISLRSIFPSPENTRGGYLLPLHYHNQPLGAIILGSKTDLSFSLDEEDLLITIANQVAVALERARLHDSVLKEQMLQRHLLKETISAQEKERKRVASEIHDGLIQSMVGISYQLQAVQSRVSDNGVSDDLQTLHRRLNASINEVRRLVQGLRPEMLDDLGLATALEEYVKDFGARNSIKTSLFIPSDIPPLSHEAETAMYRVVQEALNNVQKHAHANEVTVEIEATPDSLFLSVSDDGVGFPLSQVERDKDRELKEMLERQKNSQAHGHSRAGSHARDAPRAKRGATSGHLGIPIMKERAELLGGKLQIDSKPDKGTRVLIEVPINPITEL